MDAEAVVAVSAAVVALTSLLKWAGLSGKFAPLAVLALAALGVGVWAYSEGNFERTTLFAYFAGWVAVAVSAAGIYGFAREGSTVLTQMTQSKYEREKDQ